MIRLPLIPHKDSLLAVTILILGLYCWRAGLEIESLKAALDARPELLATHIDARTEDVRRGPVTVKRKTTTLPDGTKTTESERTIGPVESHIATKTEDTRKETPVAAPVARARTRYGGLGVNPLAYTREWRGRGGVNVLGFLDAGVALDFDPIGLKFDRPMLEATYRF